MDSTLKQKIRSGAPVIGTWTSIGHPDVAEILAGLGYDWLLLDMEHGPLGVETMHHMLQAMGGSATAGLVRVAKNDPILIAQALDAGAAGVVVPFVSTAEEARRAVAACLYPPRGRRGCGPRRAAAYGATFEAYVRSANDNVVVVLQIESPEGVANIGAMLEPGGVDAIAIGTGDLSLTMGCFDNRQDATFVAALETVRASCERHGVAPGLAYVGNAAKAREAITNGFRFVGVGEDVQLLGDAAAGLLAAIRA